MKWILLLSTAGIFGFSTSLNRISFSVVGAVKQVVYIYFVLVCIGDLENNVTRI